MRTTNLDGTLLVDVFRRKWNKGENEIDDFGAWFTASWDNMKKEDKKQLFKRYYKICFN